MGINSRITWASRSLLLATLLGGLLLPPAPVQSKTMAVTGRLDCGLPSGQACTVGTTLHLWTEDISGSKERIQVDVSWFQKHFREETYDQDDQLCLELDDAEGIFRLVGVILTCELSGSSNPGLSTGSHTVAEAPKQVKEKDPGGATAADLVARLADLPCTSNATRVTCPIPESLLREARGLGLVFQLTLLPGCYVVVRPTDTVIACANP